MALFIKIGESWKLTCGAEPQLNKASTLQLLLMTTIARLKCFQKLDCNSPMLQAHSDVKTICKINNYKSSQGVFGLFNWQKTFPSVEKGD